MNDALSQNRPVIMVREDLEHLPEFPLPEGCSLRWFEPGDEKLWLQIHLATERHRAISPELFETEFEKNKNALAQRQCFLLDKNRSPIGTATAWFDDIFHDEKYGRVHWVAVVPEFQGRGLGKVLTSAVCRRLKELGHRKAFLRTSTARLIAVSLYLQFNFQPLIRGAEDEQTWKALLEKIKGERI